jgi:hypothetical protein
MNIWQRWRQRRRRRAGKKADARQTQGLREQWFLLAGRAERPVSAPPPAQSLRPLYPPASAFWADPFLWVRDGRRYVFFEEFPYGTSRGHISALALDGEALPAGDPIPVLKEPHHLSYPFVFEVDGELYMVPEKADLKRVDLYRCRVFPDRWEFVRTLIHGLTIADATLFQHEGLWWLFGALKKPGLHLNESLWAFYSASPLSGTWNPHPQNPLVRDFSRGRPGGRIFRDGTGRLLRPSQDCVRRYGHGLNLSEITVLSPTGYGERLLWSVSGEGAGGWRAMHHLDWSNGFLVMDAQRLVP